MMSEHPQKRAQRLNADLRPDVPFRRRISTTYGFLACALIILILAGIWYTYHLSRQILYKEVQQRAKWMAWHLADSLQAPLLEKDVELIKRRITSLKIEQDLRYLVLFDNGNTQIFSHYDAQNPVSVPAAIRPLPCENPEPEISLHTVENERFYHIGLPIISPPELLQVALTQNGGCLGALHLGLSLQAVETTLHHIRMTAGVMTAGSFLLGCLGLAALSRQIIIPLRKLSYTANRMADGDWHEHIPLTPHTEIHGLELGLSRIQASSQMLADRLAAAKEHITLSAEDIRIMSEEHADVGQIQAAALYQISQTLDGLADASAHIVKQVAIVIEEMSFGLHSTHHAKDTMKELVSSMEEMRDQVGRNTERVVRLGEKVAQIDQVVKIITTIADQTKLIAFNASIEAAGAGEAGGRFSVVATEVRRLANTVVESVEEIKNSVSSIQTSTSELILSSETGIRKVNQGGEFIHDIGQTIQHLMTILEQTSRSAQEISQALQEKQREMIRMTKQVNQLSDNSEKTLEMAEHANKVARELLDFAGDL